MENLHEFLFVIIFIFYRQFLSHFFPNKFLYPFRQNRFLPTERTELFTPVFDKKRQRRSIASVFYFFGLK